jgi:short subunit dehydrogenase-like uncharacterized protein
MSEREFDIVVYGATGFTGALVAEYLARKGELEPERWALAGRNRAKLTQVRAQLTEIDARMADLAIVAADTDDAASLRAMTSRAKVVLTTVGPYARYGEPLVASCVETETDYVDLTGEPGWWKGIIERYHHKAKVAGVMIVPCCGFDSIPHDLGARHCASVLGGSGPIEIDGYVTAVGGFSGGTAASAIDAFSNLRDAGIKAGGGGGARSGSGRSRRGIHRADAVDAWVAPMPTIDPLVVKRTAAHTDDFGGELRYRHWITFKNRRQMASILAGLGVAVGVAQLGVGRRLLRRLKPSGAGPDAAQRERSWFRVTFVGRRDGRTAVTRVSGGDPGYGETAKMISESALALALDRESLPGTGGVLSPGAALGDPLQRRLEAAGIRFEVLEAP